MHVQQTWCLTLVVAHEALILNSPANRFGDFDNLIVVVIGAEHLVKGELASNGRGYLWLNVSEVVSDLLNKLTSTPLMDRLAVSLIRATSNGISKVSTPTTP